MTNRFEQMLAEKAYLLADGATGTNLFALGLQSGDAPELWNVDYPDRVATHYRSFMDAGSDIVLTNTFGGTYYRLKLHKAQDRVYELNKAGAEIARREADASGREVAIAGSMGPTGEILAPLGELQPEDAVAAFAEQAEGLKAGGVDILWIETMSSREEVELAVKGAATVNLPIVYTLSFDTNGRTMMGLGAMDLINISRDVEPHPHAFGTNCGVGASEVVAAVLNMKAAAASVGSDLAIVAKANCGIPEYVDGEIVYNGTPELMADYAVMARDAGARIIGGCCGTTPAHVAAMRKALDNSEQGPAPDMQTVVAKLGEVSAGALTQASGDAAIADRGRAKRGVRRKKN